MTRSWGTETAFSPIDRRCGECRVEGRRDGLYGARMNEHVEEHTVLNLRFPTRVAFVVAAVLLVAAAYFYWVPVNLATQTGAAFGCGSAASPPSDQFQRSVCLNTTDVNAYRAIALAAAALLVAGLSYLFFGADKETRPAPGRSVEDPAERRD